MPSAPLSFLPLVPVTSPIGTSPWTDQSTVAGRSRTSPGLRITTQADRDVVVVPQQARIARPGRLQQGQQFRIGFVRSRLTKRIGRGVEVRQLDILAKIVGCLRPSPLIQFRRGRTNGRSATRMRRSRHRAAVLQRKRVAASRARRAMRNTFLFPGAGKRFSFVRRAAHIENRTRTIGNNARDPSGVVHREIPSQARPNRCPRRAQYARRVHH